MAEHGGEEMKRIITRKMGMLRVLRQDKSKEYLPPYYPTFLILIDHIDRMNMAHRKPESWDRDLDNRVTPEITKLVGRKGWPNNSLYYKDSVYYKDCGRKTLWYRGDTMPLLGKRAARY